MLNSKSIGNKIVEARKKINLSQVGLAQQVAISAQAVGKWERGESMPDISTLNRLAEILGVDLNYFSDNFQSIKNDVVTSEFSDNHLKGVSSEIPKKTLNWNMSEGNWVNVDFSGLKNLQEKFSFSNMKDCKFLGSDLSGLILKNNNFDGCDFSGSTIFRSHFLKNNLANNSFKGCLLNETEFSGSYIYNCDLTETDLTDVTIKSGGFEKNIITNTVWNRTLFFDTRIVNVVFEGVIKDCSFEKCNFSKVTFQNVKLINTFFKYNDLKRIKFIDCQADRITYEVLKYGKADLTGVVLVS
ncbi:hypothetical protein GCM10011514_05200 [Emticicia aquatilis]|uniref:HTH cro/C1-type domain-containing protein n=1 Tax=Emticicia aquatilis TaxID=1537369 RepID=A0A916YGE3_9BACT|nr:pentapeptide repeat-containing protein [Emticicia aquatilis]GGD44215.1 hypothetical protein GCM10011514_05200 [Emticicia aquatilis]